MAVSNNPVTNRLLNKKNSAASVASSTSPTSASTTTRAVSNNPVTNRLTGKTTTKAQVIAEKYSSAPKVAETAKDEEKNTAKKTTAQSIASNKGSQTTGGTFLGGWKQPEAKEKKTPTAAEIAAQQKEAEEAAKRLSYLETLDLDEQQKKIDALTAEAKKGSTLNVHAFGAYDPNNLTETEMALAEAQEDYNLAKSLQYSAKGKKALEALDLGAQRLVDTVAKYNIEARGLRSSDMPTEAERETALKGLLSRGMTMEEIEQLADYRARQLNEQEYDAKVRKMQELASRDDLLGISDMGAVAASIASIPLNLGSGAGYLDLLMQKAHNKQMGYDRPLDYKTGAMSLYGQASAARETVSQGIMDNANTELGGQVGSFLYQTGMSMADSAVVAGLGVLGLGAGGTLLLGGSAATAAAVDAKNRGGSDSQALWSGALAGAAEAVFEKVSLDSLLTGKLTKNFVGGEFKKLLADVGVQGAVEGSEELFTAFANHITDRAVMGGSSTYYKSIREYMAAGMTDEEAEAKAMADFAAECATSFVGGVLSGGVMGGVGSAIRSSFGAQGLQATRKAETGVSGRDAAAPLSGAPVGEETVKDFASTMDKAGATAMTRLYSPEQEPTTYIEGMMKAYNAGKTGADLNTVEGLDTISPAQAEGAYLAGQADAENATAEEPGRGLFKRNKAREKTEDKTEEGNVFDAIVGTKNRRKSLGNSLENADSAAYTETTIKEDVTNEQEGNASSSGGYGRTSGVLAEGSGGSVQSRAGSTQARGTAQRLRAEEIRAAVEAEGVGKVNTASLGISTGTTRETLQVVPAHIWTDEMRNLSREQEKQGRQVIYFTGEMELRDSGGIFRARGAISPDGKRIWVRADHDTLTVEQIVKHEEFHGKVQQNTKLMEDTASQIVARYGDEELAELVEAYIEKYGFTNVSLDYVLEEILADAYGGIDIFDYLTNYEGATRYSDVVRETVKLSEKEKANPIRGPTEVKTSRESDYQKVSRQAWRQIQRERMSRYGGSFDSAPHMDTFYAHDMLFVVENLDETHFNVVDAIDPAKHHEKSKFVREVMSNGDIEYASEYRRRIENLRSWQRRNARNSVSAQNTGTGRKNAGAYAQHGGSGDGGSAAGKSGRAYEVKTSRETDSIGNKLTEEQAAYFAESKSVDAQGRLRVMYRGGGDFTVFDRKKSSYSNLYGRGFYFTDSKSHAEQYGGARAFYLNIKNPVPTDERTITKEQLLAFLRAVAENEDDYSFENYGYGATPESVADAIFSGKSDFAMLYDVSQTAIGDMVEAVELFNAINGTDFDGLILDTETVTFQSEQAKLTTNKTPTKDPDIRFSREADSEGRKLSAAQAEFFKDSKVLDENGNLKRLYHGTPKFGFTVFDKGKLDDGFSIFMTDSVAVAESYSGTLRVRSAMDDGEIDFYSMSAEELAKWNNENTRDGRLKPMSRDEVKTERKKQQAKVDETVSRYRDIAENMEDIITKLDGEYTSRDEHFRLDILDILDRFDAADTARRQIDLLEKIQYTVIDYRLGASEAARMLLVGLSDVEDAINPLWRLEELSSPYDMFEVRTSSSTYFRDIEDVREGLEETARDEDDYGNYAVYANITNPFIINGNERAWNELILPKKYRQAYIEAIGHDPGEGRIYATTRDVVKVAKHLGHDGVIFNDIIDVGAEAYDTYVSNVYVAFESNQVKDVDNLNPTENEDIRYSREATYDELREQNTTLQQQVEGYAAAVREAKKQKANAEYWKGQTQRTKQPTARQEDIDKLAKSLIKRFDGTTQVEEINGELKALAEYIIRDGDGKNALTYRAVKDKAVQIARTIVNSAEVLVNDEAMSDYKAIKKYLRENKIAFDGKGQITDWADFIRRNRGRIIIAKNGTPIDMLWGEMGSRFGYSYFPSGLTSADKMLRIEDVLDDMEPVYDNPFSRDMAEAIEYCANALLDDVLSEAVRQSPPTFADKQAAKMQRIKWREQDKAREALKRVRKDRDKKIAALKEHYTTKEAKGRESRKARELREKIDRHVKDLRRQLLQPSDKQHIPEALRQPVANLLAAINMESSFEWDGTRRVPKGTPNAQATKRTEAFNALRTKYKAIADELVVDPDLVGSDGENGLFDDVIALGNKPIASMTSAELETVWQTLRAIESSVRTANKMFAAGRFQTVREAAEELRFDNGGKKAKVEYVGPLDRAHRLVSLDMLTPEAYFHRLGESGDALFKMMRKAQDKYIEIMKAAADFTAKLKSDVKKLEKESHTVTLGGHEVQMTTAQLMELYVLARREQALGHIATGGIMPEAVRKGLKKSRTSDPINGITMEDISKACSLLTAEQVEMAEKMQSYLSNEISDYGNEASMEVYNYKKFTEKIYWPIRTNKNETKSNVEKDTQVTSVANRGFTKAVKPNANTSVMVGSIFDTFSRHTSEMATYAAWLGVTEDINRIRNFQFRDDEGNRTGTVKGLLDRVHGSQGGAYLQKLLSDISLGVRGNELEYMGGLVSNYKAASVGANLRVIIQQPTAILRALDMIDPKYLVGGLKPNHGWQKALKYAPIAQWKDWGYFDINTGRQMKDVLFDNDTVLGKARQISMMGASKMDSLAWGQLWNACELETKAKHKDLKGDALYKEVAKRFGEIVDHTQVVDGVLQRSQIMRSSSGLTKMAVSFMGEPTKQYNMLLSAAYDAKTTADKKAKQRLARSVFAFGVSGVVNAMAQSIMDAIRDDDKEEKYWEKWLQAFTGFEGEEEGFGEHFKAFWNGNLEAIINPTQYIPYAKDVFSLLQGYDVSRMDMESVEKTLDAGKNMLKALSGEGKYTIGMASANLFAEAGRLLGIPIANLKREIFSFAMHAAISSDNYMMQYRMEKATYQMNNNSTAFLDILYQAYANDPDAYKLMYADMVKSGFDAEKIRSGMETRMKKAQSVTSVDDLKSRYLTPTQQTSYDSTMSKVKRSGVWKSATAAQRKEMEGDLYDLTVGNSDGVKLQEKIAGGNPYGVGTTEYLLYELAKDVVDQPNDNGNYGTYTNEETEAAIRMLGLSNEANHFLWMETHTSDKNEPNW